MTHEERLALIYRPIMILRHLRSYPHAGTIVNDGFNGSEAGKIHGHGHNGAFVGDERHSVLLEEITQ